MSKAQTASKGSVLPLAPVTLSIVIPVYNEQSRLGLTLDALLGDIPWGQLQLTQIIFVNDGSRDDTAKLLRQAKTKLQKAIGVKVLIIAYDKNRGKGYAIRQGMLAASGDYILMMDVDVSTPLTEIARLQTGVKHARPIIIGTRKSRVVRVEKEQPFIRVFMGRVYTQLAQSILDTYVSDFTCGFKLFRRDAAGEIFSRALIDRWSYDSEIMFLAVRLGYKPLEVAVRWRNDERSRVHILRDTLRSFYDLWRIRFYQVTGRYNLPERIGQGTKARHSSDDS